ncbi:GntR family transcriptional regulator [Streptococcus sobrinus]|uniref:GntR family transcriptional regulator n=1 Tax=Streptococcus sobrinus TaxID=1310 RepID=UPI000D707FED|nr:GntR family transcriptional regulator [Streptococcus sobrinus]AWN61877.1 GntR family transcriptional regulator [Streptococcus sobrinus]
MAWTFDEKSPIYLQIAKNIKIKIVSQGMKQGEQLPTVRDYAQEAGVNPNTMQRAFTELEREGIVFSRRTSGRFVTEDEELIKGKASELAEDEIAGFASNMANIGFSNQEILEETKKYLMNQSEK